MEGKMWSFACVVPVLGRSRQADFHESGASLDYTSIPGPPKLQSKILFQIQKQTTITTTKVKKKHRLGILSILSFTS